MEASTVRKLFTISILGICLLSSGKSHSQSRNGIGIFGGYSHYSFRSQSGDILSPSIREFDLVPNTYTIGVDYFQALKSFSIGAGLNVRRIKIVDPWANQGGWFQREEFTNQILSIPIFIGYCLNQNSKLKIVPQIGFSPNAKFYFKYEEYNPSNDELKYSERGFDFYNLTLNGFAEIQIKYQYDESANAIGLFLNYNTQLRRKLENNTPWRANYHMVSIGLRVEYGKYGVSRDS